MVEGLLDDQHEARRSIRELFALLAARDKHWLLSFCRRSFEVTHPDAVAAVDEESRLAPVLESLIRARHPEVAVGEVADADLRKLRALARAQLEDDRAAATLGAWAQGAAGRARRIRRGALREVMAQLDARVRAGAARARTRIRRRRRRDEG